ncbi:hypothetical protein VTJ83DRAFT_4624 [Remersonia thermophila]|uniref:Uncharacterized protein n=1 Tax=Remersonia thermophila TaxID=72144 RepID=A0ABR4DCN4_9PEZI
MPPLNVIADADAPAIQNIAAYIWPRTEDTTDTSASISSDIQATIGVTVFAGCILIAVGGWFLRKHLLARKKRKQEAEEAEAEAAGAASDDTTGPYDEFEDGLGKRPELEGSRVAHELSGMVVPKELEAIEKPVELGGTPRAELETCWNDALTWSAVQQRLPITSTVLEGPMKQSPSVITLPSSSSLSAAVTGTSTGALESEYKSSLRFSPFADPEGILRSSNSSTLNHQSGICQIGIFLSTQFPTR